MNEDNLTGRPLSANAHQTGHPGARGRADSGRVPTATAELPVPRGWIHYTVEWDSNITADGEPTGVE